MTHRCYEIARHDGVAAALRALGEDMTPGALPFGPGGHAVVPAGWPAGDPQSASPPELMFTIALGEDRIAVVRRQAAPAGPAGERHAHPEGTCPRFTAGICWLRLGTSRWLLAHAVSHAQQRKVGEEPLLGQQLVKAMVADTLTAQLQAQALLDGDAAPSAAVLAQASALILAADRIALRVLGASGFTAGLASHTAWVSELLADAYLGPGGT
jgi:hypothetical protein